MRRMIMILVCALLECTVAWGVQAPASMPPPAVGHRPPMPVPVDAPDPSFVKVESFASGLVVPWDIAFPSPTRMYVTERPGRVRLIENGKLRAAPYAKITRVASNGEGGLMGIALHPQYSKTQKVYLMYAYRSGGKPFNRVSVFDDTGKTLTNEKVLIEGIAGAAYHDGGALRFGPDGMLYIGTGDGGNPGAAQNKKSLNGKILRLTPEGKPPDDNPFPGSPVYAYGLRNVQGLAWNPANGELWATNHGPSGEWGLQAMDSVFIIKKGGNYGWPKSIGVTNAKGVTPPILWFPQYSVPPPLAIFYRSKKIPRLDGNFLFASLRDEDLYRVVLSGPHTVSRVERWFATGVHQGRFGRLRAVVEGPDGAIYITTSNRDRRGTVHPNDDHIYRITAK